MKHIILALTLVLFSASFVYATDNLNPEELSAKSYLEDLLVHRYTQSLATIVDRQGFSIGAQLQLTDAPKAKLKEEKKPAATAISDTPDDLLLGTLDPEQLIKQYNLPDEKAAIVGVLASKRIKTVSMFVGLREDLGEPVKADVQKWLTAKLTGEFGKTAKGEVSFVKVLPEKKPDVAPLAPKQWWDWLNQFQQLASQLLLAFAVLFGIILWRFTTSKASVNTNNTGDSPDIKLKADGLGAGGVGGTSTVKTIEQEQQEAYAKQEALAMESVQSLSQKLINLVPRLTNDFERIVRAWCQGGEEGKYKLACFAEAVGRDVGRLPIPVDSMKDIGKIFARMSKLSAKDKSEYLEKVYWDLVGVLNLGPEILAQPFGYLSGVDSTIINKMLMDQNPKMKTLVSLYLPDEVRRKFLKPLQADQKMELLENAAQLSEIAADDLESMNRTIFSKLNLGVVKDMIPLQMTLEKIVNSLSVREEIEMLGHVKGQGILEYRRKYPSLAFLDQWPDGALGTLLSRMQADQVTEYLRLKPEMKDRVIGIAPPMLAEIVADELTREDKMREDDKTRVLESLAALVKKMYDDKDLDLSTIFPDSSSAAEGNNVVPIKSA